jgi:hypothetical protein
MKRSTFLLLAAVSALAVGAAAIAAPAAFLASKGVVGNAAAEVWMREVGVLIFASGVASIAMRTHVDSPTLRVWLLSNAVVQLGLLPIEALAYRRAVITSLPGILPNTLLHVLLAGAFLFYASRVSSRAARPTERSGSNGC